MGDNRGLTHSKPKFKKSEANQTSLLNVLDTNRNKQPPLVSNLTKALVDCSIGRLVESSFFNHLNPVFPGGIRRGDL